MGYWWIGIGVAAILFLIGMKVMKWLMWGLAIVAIIIGIIFYF